ncbi:hypothetical protein AD006_32350 (plasmid) [Pseudonocardia sp. EC080610-09]|uniref:SAM-dependent methyltransferase n=1 Tax=Pseudonocardia sp. EC080610-09 TaxID=1688404 RepID=UPI00070652BE|nr:methyltransferase domain-containing protein [Pseudonocardia sp. EC080610-09]ALL79927.1 hypothetical protein AD006_32350 [Pseudonocardia sp. EC080610-09]
MSRSRPTTDNIRATYDGFTDTYARVWGENLHVGYWDEPGADSPVAAATDRLNSELIARLRTQPGDAVLDVGCGIGRPALRLARELDVSVVGVTISVYQVERATDNARAEGLGDRVSFSEADVCSLPFDDRSFDAVWAMESLHHVADRAGALSEIYRVLRPGGCLAMADFSLRRPASGAELDVITGFREAGGVATLTLIEDVLGDLRAAGLELESLTDVGDYVRPTMARHADLFRQARPMLEPRMGVVALDEMIIRNEQLATCRPFGYILLSACRPVVSP